MNLHAILADIFPFLVIFYLMDSLLYLRAGHLLFSNFGYGPYHLRKRAGWHLLGVMPFESHIVVDDSPLLLTTRALWVPRAKHLYERRILTLEDYLSIPYESMKPIIAEQKKVSFGTDDRITLSGPRQARHMSSLLKTLRDTPQTERQSILDGRQKQAFDQRSVYEKQKRFHSASAIIKVFSTLQFLALFFGIAWHTYGIPGKILPLPGLLISMLTLHLLIIFSALAVYGQLFTGEQKGRRMLLLTFALTPLSTLQAGKHISRELFSEHDALTVASCLLNKNGHLPLFRRRILRLDYLRKGLKNPDVDDAVSAQITQINTLMSESGLDQETLWAAPARRDQEAAQYCPLCDAEFNLSAELCSECEYPLRTF